MEELTAKSSLRCCDRRLKSGSVANAVGAAIPIDLQSLNFQNFFEGEENRVHPFSLSSF